MLTLEDIDSVETNRWLQKQLDCLKDLVLAHGEDPEMLEAIEYLRGENEAWADPQVEQLMSSKRMTPGSSTDSVN